VESFASPLKSGHPIKAARVLSRFPAVIGIFIPLPMVGATVFDVPALPLTARAAISLFLMERMNGAG
jgi:hypothetical protein